MYLKFHRKRSSTIDFQRPRFFCWGELRRVLVVSGGIAYCQGKRLALRRTSYGSSSGEMHREFGVRDKLRYSNW